MYFLQILEICILFMDKMYTSDLRWRYLVIVYSSKFFTRTQLMGHVLVLMLNVLSFYEYFTSTSEYFLNICCENLFLFVVNKMKLS